MAKFAARQRVRQDGYSIVVDGSKDITTAGTAEQLAADQTCASVLIQVRYNNVGRFVAIGASTVVAAQTGRRGIILAKGQIIELLVTNLNLIWLDVLQNGDGVTFTCFS